MGLATGNVAKKILTLAGIEDCWAFTKGKTKTTVNYAKAVFNALQDNAEMRIMPYEKQKIGMVTGSIGLVDKTGKVQQEKVEEPTEEEKLEKKEEN